MRLFTHAVTNRRRRKFFAALLTLILAIGGMSLMSCAPKFGKYPEGERLERLQRSPNYGNGAFRNQVDTPPLAKGQGVLSALLTGAFSKNVRLVPVAPVPSVKTDLKSLDATKDTIVWLGHSSFFLLLGGKRILIDPVFNDHAAPLPLFNRAFAGTNVYTAEDMPDIDYLLITHDHWDHLDYPTVTALKPKVASAVCPLGVGAHLEYWGYGKETIHEGDWYDAFTPQGDFTVRLLPARHFSGRLLTRNKTLWTAFSLETPARRVFISGDSGYAPHFAEIGHKLGGFDLVILENGQYDTRWPYIHMVPEDTAQAALDLRAKTLIPAHSGRFAMARHPWDEPLKRLAAASQGKPYRFLTPVIGEPVFLDEEKQTFSPWWEGRE